MKLGQLTYKKSILTVWKIKTYDVWGNAKDGFDVNDVYNRGEISLLADVERHNVNTPQEFESASLSESQIRKVFMLGKKQLQIDGDDLTYYVNLARNGYPVGQLECESHESLSPIRIKSEK